jgi:hypothetical protein
MIQKMEYNASTAIGQDQKLAEIDDNHRVYLCEYGLIHLKWGEDNLPYCPGDFIGLPFLLHGLGTQCNLECMRGEECTHTEGDDELVYLQYGSVRVPLTPEACHDLQIMVKQAVKRVHQLRSEGYFSAQKWGLAITPKTNHNGHNER